MAEQWLYPIVLTDADNEDEATDRLLEALKGAGFEVRGWLTEEHI